MRAIYISLVFFTFTLSCGNKDTNCTITANDLVVQQGNRMLTSFSAKGEMRKAINNGLDSTSGVYSFFRNGHLQHYRFFANSKAYTYSEEYDESGKLIKMEGNPLVYSKIRLVNRDSVFFKLYFFTGQKKYDDVVVTTNTNERFHLSLKDDSVFTHMKHASFGMNRKGLEDVTAFVYANYKMLCDPLIHSLKDTFDLHYTPPEK